MKKLLAFALIACLASAAGAFVLTADPAQTGTVNCAGNAAAPTLLLANDPAAKRTYIVNTSTTNIFIGFMSTTSTSSVANMSISLSSGSFYVPASTTPYVTSTILTPVIWSPDGPNDSYTGPLWCVGQSGANTVQRIRLR